MPHKQKRTLRRSITTTSSKQKPERPKRQPPCPCIVELSSDGFVQVYGPVQLRVRVIVRLHVKSGRTATNLEYLNRLRLPRSHKEYYEPRHVRASGQCEKITIQSEAKRLDDLALLHTIREVGKAMKGDSTR